jgi:hypothetical protein
MNPITVKSDKYELKNKDSISEHILEILGWKLIFRNTYKIISKLIFLCGKHPPSFHIWAKLL